MRLAFRSFQMVIDLDCLLLAFFVIQAQFSNFGVNKARSLSMVLYNPKLSGVHLVFTRDLSSILWILCSVPKRDQICVANFHTVMI